jgi:16S rRNA (guanine966-N2)-methyltransferase
MRITGGKARGIVLKVPKDKRIRPALDQVRERVFSSIGVGIEGASVLDLFAGTGSYGLEAMSRGAISATFVELEKQSSQVIRLNIASVLKSMQATEKDVATEVITTNVFSLKRLFGKFDYIFADPPYSLIEENKVALFDLVKESIAEDGSFWLEAPGEFECEPEGWKLVRKKGGKRGSPSSLVYQLSSH